jgi:Fe-Mn family superoxide dismutase
MPETIEKAALHVLPPLPYAENALDPAISANTLGFHYGKHHKGYVDTLNKLIAGTELAHFSLDRVVAETSGKGDKVAIFNNAAQAWNHTFYWRSLRPNGGGAPPAGLKHRIDAAFGNLDACKKELATAATSQFGSGWAWLVLAGDKTDTNHDAAAKQADARADANIEKRDAEYKVAIEKCDALAGATKDACVGSAKVQYGKQ